MASIAFGVAVTYQPSPSDSNLGGSSQIHPSFQYVDVTITLPAPRGCRYGARCASACAATVAARPVTRSTISIAMPLAS